jgi:hypothetical protein
MDDAVMTQIDQGWGAPASTRYEQLAAPFRSIFDDIRATAVTNGNSPGPEPSELGPSGVIRLARACWWSFGVTIEPE